jgi:hypothetical protein
MSEIRSVRSSRIRNADEIEGLKRLMQENFDRLDRKFSEEFNGLQKVLHEERRVGLNDTTMGDTPGREGFLVCLPQDLLL